MFRKVFKRQKPRVYLGVVAAVPRADIKRHLENSNLFQREDLDKNIRQNLQEIFSLPPKEDVISPENSDLVLDVIVTKFQLGNATFLDLGELSFPLIWRPKVTVCSRLYRLESEETKAIFSVTEKMNAGEFLRRILSWRRLLSFRSDFDSKDMELLLYRACHKLLLKMQKAI